MNWQRTTRWIGAALLALLLSACVRTWSWGDGAQRAQVESVVASNPVARTLAPTGVLRVGVYAGSPTSLVIIQGQKHGIAHDLGHALAQQLGVPVQLVEFPRVAEVVTAVHEGRVDFTFTNATTARAQMVDFTPALVRLELGVLVPRNSAIRSVADLDRAGVRVGVSQGSSSQSTLGARLQWAQVVPQPSLAAARQALERGELDAFATNKGILFELADQLPQHHVLSDAWGHEQLAIAVPPGRKAAMPWLQEYARQAMQQGQINQMASRAGLRGLVP